MTPALSLLLAAIRAHRFVPVDSTCPLTQADVRRLFIYDPETGIFRNRVKRARCVIPGTVAGCLYDNGYWIIGIDKQSYPAHRLAFLYMLGVMPEMVDHINGVRNDNRFCNLRAADHSLNMQNIRHAKPHSTTGMLGAHKGYNGQFSSEIQHRGKRYRLGSFTTAEAARDAYLAAKRRIHEGCTI